MSRVIKSTKKSTSGSLSDGGAPRHRHVAKWITALATGFLGVSLFASPVIAQAQESSESSVTHQSHDYPSSPPYSSILSEATFSFRDLRNELRNKMTGTYTVTSAGDLYWRFPVAQRTSPQLRDLLRNADTAVGNLEGGVTAFPQDRAKDM